MGVRDLCLHAINHGILAREAAPTTTAKYFKYVYCHMKVYTADRNTCADELVWMHFVGEEYASVLPKQMKIEEEKAARLHFTNVVRNTLKSVKASSPDFTACFPKGLTYESYEKNAEFEVVYKEGQEWKKYPDPIKNPADFRAKVSVLLDFNNKKANAGGLFETAYDIVLMVAQMMVPIRINLPTEALFLVFVTFSKKGLVTTEYIKKVEGVIQEELKLMIKLNEGHIKKIWKCYESKMSADFMERCMKATLTDLPEESVRLRRLVELCKWHGLTCYQAVKQAYETFPHFPWDRLKQIGEYQKEIKAYEEASRMVGDNAFYGYNQTMKSAKSIHYKNLASVCAKILVETKKSPALDKAACFTKSYVSKGAIDQIVTEYMRREKLTGKKPKVSQPKTASGTSPGTSKTNGTLTDVPKTADALSKIPKLDTSDSDIIIGKQKAKEPVVKIETVCHGYDGYDELDFPCDLFPDSPDYPRDPSPDFHDYCGDPSPDFRDYCGDPSPDFRDYCGDPSPDFRDYCGDPSPDFHDYYGDPSPDYYF